MKVRVIYESCFTNTEKVAEAVAAGMRGEGAEVALVPASQCAATGPDSGDAELVVIGAPTHNLGLPSAASRQQASAKGGTAETYGVAEWLAARPQLRGRRTAAFCTCSESRFAGSAAKKIKKHLRRLGADVIAQEDFHIEATEGPLGQGELERAQQWGAALVR